MTDALNTRFDVYNGNSSCPSPGSCPASINSVKDVIRPANADNTKKGCLMDSKDGWQEVVSGRYEPSSPNTPLATTTTPSAMGHPRDMCHAVSVNGSCTAGRVGDGLWDRDAYFRVNYRRAGVTPYWKGGTGAGTWQENTGLPANATRYQVYNWEIARRDQVIDGVTVLAKTPSSANGNALAAYGKPQCSASQGYGPGYVPGGTIPDRRRISAAVINCTAQSVNGNSTNVQVEKWIELFLVEPSLNRLSGRTNAGDVYFELIGETTAGAGATAGQVVRRDLPYLVK